MIFYGLIAQKTPTKGTLNNMGICVTTLTIISAVCIHTL
jgi:hypothetical protein